MSVPNQNHRTICNCSPVAHAGTMATIARGFREKMQYQYSTIRPPHAAASTELRGSDRRYIAKLCKYLYQANSIILFLKTTFP